MDRESKESVAYLRTVIWTIRFTGPAPFSPEAFTINSLQTKLELTLPYCTGPGRQTLYFSLYVV